METELFIKFFTDYSKLIFTILILFLICIFVIYLYDDIKNYVSRWTKNEPHENSLDEDVDKILKELNID